MNVQAEYRISMLTLIGNTIIYGCQASQRLLLRIIFLGAPTDLRVDNIASWLRTGAMGSTNRIDGIAAEGILTTNYVSVSTLGIRPAFHLNLTAAEESSVIPITTPTDVTSTYNAKSKITLTQAAQAVV